MITIIKLIIISIISHNYLFVYVCVCVVRREKTIESGRPRCKPGPIAYQLCDPG